MLTIERTYSIERFSYKKLENTDFANKADFCRFFYRIYEK
jgi:hypothetical protein